MTRVSKLSLSIVLGGLIIISPKGSLAQNILPSFSLMPAKSELSMIAGGQTSQVITVTNHLGRENVFTLGAEDIVPTNDESSGFKLGPLASQYSLKPYLTFSTNTLTLNDGESGTVTAQINLPTNLAPGGRYAAITVSATPLGAGQTKVTTSLASLLFVRIAGELEERAELKQFGLIGGALQFFKPEARFYFSVKNTGNVYLNPYGQIVLSKRLAWGQKGNLIIKPNFVLADSTRLFEVPLSLFKNKMCGWYQAKLELNLGFDNKVQEERINLFTCSMLQLPLWGRK